MAYIADTLETRREPRHAGFIAECSMFFTILGAAMRVSRAVDGRRQPDAGDLKVLGVDPETFQVR